MLRYNDICTILKTSQTTEVRFEHTSTLVLDNMCQRLKMVKM